jgi:hypothetical protein
MKSNIAVSARALAMLRGKTIELPPGKSDNLPRMSSNDVQSRQLRLQWTAVGLASLDSGGKVKFPILPAKAGLYQFRIKGPKGDIGRYIGESDNLQRRFAHYRNPGPTQQTNLRLNALLREVLATGGTVEIAVTVDDAFMARDGIEETVDLTNKNVRRLFENFALVASDVRDILDLNK